MLVIRVELHPFGDSSQIREIARMALWNDGTGSPRLGNFKGKTVDGDLQNDQMLATAIYRAEKGVGREAVVLEHLRKSHVWVLVAKMLAAMGYNDEDLRQA